MANGENSVLIVAAEASSSLYAQRILEIWKSQNKEIHAFGIGSYAMEEAGFEIVGRSEEMAVVGLQEVIKHFRPIAKTFNELVRLAKERKPKVALLLDYPDFNLRLAKRLKALGIPVVYYISPQVWAWRQSRVHTIRERVDKMLCIFPFEEEFYRKHGVRAKFVGHPLLDEMGPDLFDDQVRTQKRGRYGLKADDVLLGLMPGSRQSEVKHNLKSQLEAAKILQKMYPKCRAALLVAPTFKKEYFQDKLKDFDSHLMVIKEDPLSMMQISDVILVASGTATLMVGMMSKPMVIMYRMNAITSYFAKRLVKVPFFGMANLVMGKKVVDELFQEDAEAEGLVKSLEPLVANASKRLELSKSLGEIKNRLGNKGANQRVVAELEEYFVGEK